MAIIPFAASPILDTQFLKPSTNSELLIPFTVSRPYLNSIKLFPVPLEAVPGILTPFHAYKRWPLPLEREGPLSRRMTYSLRLWRRGATRLPCFSLRNK